MIRSLIHQASVISNYFRVSMLRIAGVKIGRRTFISRGAKIDVRNGQIIIGDDCGIAHGTVILSHDGPAGEMGKPYAKTTVIGNDVRIGVNSVILPGITIGDHAVVSAASFATRDVAEAEVVGGNPARPIGQRAPEYWTKATGIDSHLK